jgi:hypothetical protein
MKRTPSSFAGPVTSNQLSAQLTANQIDAFELLYGAYTGLNKRICSFQTISHSIWRAFDATVLTRELLNSTFLQARWIDSEILQVWNCYSVPPTAIEFSASQSLVCYQKLPVNVTLNGKTTSGFLEPRKGIISTHSPTGPCESWESIVVEFDGRIIQFDHLFVNGTFKSSPPLFSQVVALLAKRGDYVVPTMYALLTNKTRATYDLLFEMIKNVMIF